MGRRFADRLAAGRELGSQLLARGDLRNPVVLALPRGGVPVAFQVAMALGAPLDVLIVRKLGTPGQPELAMGAIASGGVRVLNPNVVSSLRISAEEIAEVEGVERRELERRERVYRGDRPAAEVEGRTAVLVDDGVATGSSVSAAIKALRLRRPESVWVAVPVAPPDACVRLASEAEVAICVATPEPFYAISLFYDEFPQVSDQEVRDLLERAARRSAEPGATDLGP